MFHTEQIKTGWKYSSQIACSLVWASMWLCVDYLIETKNSGWSLLGIAWALRVKLEIRTVECLLRDALNLLRHLKSVELIPAALTLFLTQTTNLCWLLHMVTCFRTLTVLVSVYIWESYWAFLLQNRFLTSQVRLHLIKHFLLYFLFRLLSIVF